LFYQFGLDSNMGKTLLIWGLFFGILLSCTPKSKEEEQGFDKLRGLGEASLDLSGKELSDLYCQACHIKPHPDLLDKTTWKNSVLPDMRRRLGLINAEDFGAKVGEDNDAPPGIYSEKTLITQADWDKIQEYYLSQAPDSLESIPFDINLKEDTGLFRVRNPDFHNKRPSLTTLVRYHPHEKLLYVGDRLNSLFRIDPIGMNVLDSIRIISPASDIRFKDSGFELLTMGVMDPSNYAFGRLEDYTLFEKKAPTIFLDSLRRPVHLAFADLTQNGEDEIIISFFGNHIGSLSWFEKSETGYNEHILNPNPGARKTIVEDVNGDGLPDVIAMMTQAKEGIYTYINQGDGNFKQEIWLEFDSVFGSSDFDWEDMDGDGFKDLVVVNGDNADLSPILKPYHGLRIFSNDSKNNFRESYFYPMHGASALLTGDFDQDGKMGVAVSSYFPDKSASKVLNFLLFQQTGNGEFQVSSIEELGKWSWLVMEKADIDGDGDLDIVLGSFDFQTRFSYPPKDWMPFVILENQSQ
jgi:hypothetical protein